MMFKKVPICGKVSLVASILFVIVAIVIIRQEVKAGTFALQQSPGVATICLAIGLLFFYTIKYLEVKANKQSNCSFKS